MLLHLRIFDHIEIRAFFEAPAHHPVRVLVAAPLAAAVWMRVVDRHEAATFPIAISLMGIARAHEASGVPELHAIVQSEGLEDLFEPIAEPSLYGVKSGGDALLLLVGQPG